MIAPERTREEWSTVFLICLGASVVFMLFGCVALIAAIAMLSPTVGVLCAVLIACSFLLGIAAFDAGMRTLP